ncbi:hypothetical protein [Methanobacterium sp. ACI-7]|uniref:hypothetical protein n=1 Tax=unclassified Methanobacterium TaxID=2627676 RepID=UPI0039C31A69
MNLNNEELEMLQEQLIIIYKIIHQNRMMNAFYFQGIDSDNLKGNLINKINELEDPEDTLKACIVEIEEMKENKNLEEDIFNEILERNDISFLNKKYCIKNTEDLDRLDVKQLLCLI